MEDNEFPSENEEVKKGAENKTRLTLLTRTSVIIANKMAMTKKINHFNDTLAAIPIVIEAKYTLSSNGDLTGFRNRTIDRAPTIPKESAIFPEIILVITYVMIGRIRSVVVCAFV